MSAPRRDAVPEVELRRALWEARPWRHLVLVGSSGAGKTTAAPMVARALGMAVVDLDAAIEAQAQAPIATIFATSGEAAFRRLELTVLKRLLARKTPTVIALGGGTWHQSEARAQLVQHAQEVFLQVSWATACARLEQSLQEQVRPKLAGGEPCAALAQLMQERAQSHALCRITVSAEEGPEAVARAVVDAAAGLRCGLLHEGLVAQHGSTRYPIRFSCEAPAELVRQLSMRKTAGAVALLADAHVFALMGARYKAALEAAGHRVVVCPIPPGESHKTLEQVTELVAQLSAAGLGRTDVVVGLGGGMALDVAAFVAGIFVRGIAFWGVATTALAAVDASVGGKCGVNLGAAKNQVGLIRPPAGVLVDVRAVMQQPGAARLEGAIEALKMGALFAPELMAQVQALEVTASADAEPWRQVMAAAVALKIAVCARDPQERGLRKALNYGHTLGHAFESGSQWRMGHGQAVALGMVAEAEFAERQRLARDVAAPLRAAVRAMNMDPDWRRATVNVQALRRDKKGDGHTVVLPIVSTLGRVSLHTIPMAQLIDFVRSP